MCCTVSFISFCFFYLFTRHFSCLATFRCSYCLAWQLSQMSLPFLSPLFVFQTVSSSHLLFEPQLQSSVFLPSCLPCHLSSDKPDCAVSRISCETWPFKHKPAWTPAGVRAAWRMTWKTYSPSALPMQRHWWAAAAATIDSGYEAEYPNRPECWLSTCNVWRENYKGARCTWCITVTSLFTKGKEMHRSGLSLHSTGRRMQNTRQYSVTLRSEPVNRMAKK